MQKEKLRNLKRINATPKMVKMAKENKKKMVYKSIYGNTLKRDTEYDLFIRCQTRGKLLMVCVFEPKYIADGELTPTYEIYCNPEGSQYITRILQKGKEVKWSSAMADNLGRIGTYMFDYSWYQGKEKRIWQNPEGRKTIKQFLKTKEEGLNGLIEWQRKVRADKIKEAEAREQKPWDEDMKLVPKLVPSFDDWMKKEAAGEYYIFYEYSRKGATTGYCSHCRKEVSVKNPKHNKEGKCPNCRKSIQYKAAGKIQTLGTLYYKAQIIQKIKGGIVIRTYSQHQWYRDTDYRKPKSWLLEEKRVLIMDNGTVKRYDWALYKNKFQRWILNKGSVYFEDESTKLYKRNLKSIDAPILRNSAITLWDKLPTGVARYFNEEQSNPAIEKLARIGMFKLAAELIKERYDYKLFKEDATELTRMLKIDGERLKRLKAMDGGVICLRWLQHEKQVNTQWPDGMIKDFADSGFEVKNAFDFLPVQVSYVKIWNYLKKQSLRSGKSMRDLLGTWRDYLNMAKKAKMNIKAEQIYKPKDLKAAHAEVILILQSGEMEKEAKALQKKWPKVNKIVPRLKKFEYSDGTFTVLAPEGILDIVREGYALQHCVHQCDFYFDRIQKDETYLFFLRRADNESQPWYTLEVEPSGNIRQKRTTGDNQEKDLEIAVKFLRKWQKEFRKRMTEEEKLLGVKAEEVRIREYEKLRKDGNRIWKGKLKGQLLVDVLEKDFMPAVI